VNDAKEVWTHFSRVITVEYLAGIHALFYFARDKQYVECYENRYSLDFSESSLKFRLGDEEVRDSFMHVFHKTNAMDNILISLYALGHAVMAEKILSKYGSGFTFHWLENARNGKLFHYPDFSGY
jgi:hypothetical protein